MNKFCALPPTPKTRKQLDKLSRKRDRFEIAESIDEYLARGGVITRCKPGISTHVSDWESLPGRADNSEEPYCKDVNVSSWSVGSSVAGAIIEAYREANPQEIYE